MDLKIILLVTVLAVSATAHQEMKKRASIFDSVPAVLKHLGTVQRMAAAAKMKVKKTKGLKDDETCGTCMEVFDDLQALILSDEMSDNIDWFTNLVKMSQNILKHLRIVFLKQCEIGQLIYGFTDDQVEECIEFNGPWWHQYASDFANYHIEYNKDDICSILFTDCSF